MTFSGIKKKDGPFQIGGRIVKVANALQSKTSNRSSHDGDRLPSLGGKRKSVVKVDKLNVSVDISRLALTSTLFMKQEKQHRNNAMEKGVPKRIRGNNLLLSQLDPLQKLSKSALAA